MERISNILAVEGETATLQIKAKIGNEGGLDGTAIASEIQRLSQEGIEALNIRINSGGGDVMDTLSIYSEIVNSQMKVTSYIDGVAASAGALLAFSADTVKMADLGQMMIHEAQGSTQTEEQQKAVERFNKIVSDIVQKRTQWDEEKTKQALRETSWYNAEQAQQAGLVDEIFTLGVPKPATNGTPDELMSVYNELLKQKSREMEGIKAKLELDSSASEQKVENKVDEILKTKNDLEQKLENKSNELEEAKNSLSEYRKKEAQDVVQNAVDEGRIDSQSQESWLEEATNDLERTKKLIQSIPPKKENKGGSPRGAIANAQKTNQTVDDRKPEKGLRTLMAEDPAEVERLANEDPEVYNQLYFEAYGKYPS